MTAVDLSTLHHELAKALASHSLDGGGCSCGTPDSCLCGERVYPEPQADHEDITERRALAFAKHQSDALMPTVVQALTDAWDNGFIAADMNTPRSRKGHWKDDHPRKGLRTWIPDPIPINPFASSGDTTNGDKASD